MSRLQEQGDERRATIVAFIATFSTQKGYAPTVREISDYMGINIATTHRHLVILMREGRITFTPRTARSIRVLDGE